LLGVRRRKTKEKSSRRDKSKCEVDKEELMQKRMVGRTAEDVRDNIVKIADENCNFARTGFFIHKEYCVTCHHNICRLDEIYVEREEYDIQTEQQRKRRYHAAWVEEFSDILKDVAFLKCFERYF
jgi:hypothetical protein